MAVCMSSFRRLPVTLSTARCFTIRDSFFCGKTQFQRFIQSSSFNSLHCSSRLNVTTKLTINKEQNTVAGASVRTDSALGFGFDQSYEGNNDRQQSGWRYVSLPTSLVAISFFSKKKDEVEEAKKKLKDVDELELFLRRAKLAESRREWSDAAEFYHQALSLLNFRQQEKIWEEQRVNEAQVYIYDNMANLALSRGRLKEAELLYKEVVKGFLGIGKAKDDNAIVEVSLKLAMIYAMQQREKESEAGYKFCMNTMDKKITSAGEVDDNTLALYGMCINSYSRFLIIHDRLKEAEAALKKTLEIALRALSKDHEQVAVLYSDLATVATMQENHKVAKEHIDRAVEIGQRCQSPDLATYLCNKGLICMESGEFSEGEKCCRKALQIAKDSKDKDTEKEAELCLKDIMERKKQKK